jgi:hypothetical protein
MHPCIGSQCIGAWLRSTAAAFCRSTLTGCDGALSPFELTAVTTNVEVP